MNNFHKYRENNYSLFILNYSLKKHPFRHSSQRLLSLPASGNRNRATGALASVGVNGDYWSSAPSAAGNSNGGFLWFNAGNMNPLHGDNRAYAFPVRCVQHLQAAFSKNHLYLLDKAAGPE